MGPSHVSPLGGQGATLGPSRKNSSSDFAVEGGMVSGPPRSTSYSFDTTTSANTGLSSMTNSFYSPGINSPGGLNNHLKGLSSTNGRSQLSLTVNTAVGGYTTRDATEGGLRSASDSPRFSRDFNHASLQQQQQQQQLNGRFPVAASDDNVFNKAAVGRFGR